ncbi:MAG TPA: DPP IV N-terminal domain-containing protein, partial [Blastocatellia bacterium]|nr:DPP IV N-terminal domain-containing protein [Blastocatellia bacterium]
MKSHAKRMLLVFVVSLGAVLPGSAQQKRAMTPEDVIALRQVSGAEISPDGKWVAYVVSTNDMKEDAANPDIWLVSTSGGQAVQLTTSEKADTSPRWSPDGKTLGFISARDGKPQVYLISPFGGEASKLTDSKTGVESFSWSPDGSRIAYVARQELTKEEEQKEKDKDDTIVVDHNFRMNHIWVIDVKTKKSNELVKGDYSASDPQWSPDGRTLAFVTTPTPKADDSEATDIWTIGVESGNPKKLTDNPGTDAAPRWSPDGTKIAYLSHDDTEGLIGQVHLMTMSPDGGGKHQIAPGFKYQPGAATWSPDGALIYFTSEVGTTSQIFSIPSAGGEVKQISHVEDAAIGPVTFSKDASAVAFTKSDFQHPDDIYVVMSLASFQPQKLSNHNPQVEGFDLGRGD